MERIDKIISSQGKYSRSEVKKLISKKRIKVNGILVSRPEEKFNVCSSEIYVNDELISFKKNLYLILNKPKGYVSATEDRNDKTVIELVPENLKRNGLFPAGRLDKDTTGMMIITDDGEFAHNILAPRKHIKKTYRVVIDKEIDEKMIKQFEKGIVLNDHVCCSAEFEVINPNTALVTITEGKYHQIKRMFGNFGAKVLELHRISMGKLDLPQNLKVGECRELTEEELKLLTDKS